MARWNSISIGRQLSRFRWPEISTSGIGDLFPCNDEQMAHGCGICGSPRESINSNTWPMVNGIRITQPLVWNKGGWGHGTPWCWLTRIANPPAFKIARPKPLRARRPRHGQSRPITRGKEGRDGRDPSHLIGSSVTSNRAEPSKRHGSLPYHVVRATVGAA